MKIKIEMSHNEIQKIVNVCDNISSRMSGDHHSVKFNSTKITSRFINGTSVFDESGNTINLTVDEPVVEGALNLLEVFADTFVSAYKTIRGSFKAFDIFIGDIKETDFSGNEIPAKTTIYKTRAIKTDDGGLINVEASKNVTCTKSEISSEHMKLSRDFEQHIH